MAERLGREHLAYDGGVRLKVVPERLAIPEEDNARSNGIGAAAMLLLVELVLLAAILSWSRSHIFESLSGPPCRICIALVRRA